MRDDEIVAILRGRRTQLSAVEMAELLDGLTNSGLTQATLVTYFKRAFPDIPLRALLDAVAWTPLGHGDLTDGGLNELLRPWLDQRFDPDDDG